MNGDQKLLIFFGKLELSEPYQKEIRKIRKQFNIPLSGFRSREKGSQWLWEMKYEWDSDMFKPDNRGYKKLAAYRQAKKDLVKVLTIPPSLGPVLDEKIVFAKNILAVGDFYSENAVYGCTLLQADDSNGTLDPKEYWSASGSSYATLLIHKGANKSDVKRYVQNNWYKIQEIIGGGKRLRGMKNQKRDNLIYRLSLLPKRELEKKLGCKREYKEMLIAELLSERYGYKNTKYTNVRKIIERQRKIRRGDT